MSTPMTAEQIARHVVAEAVWAPSVNNSQPWRFVVGPDQIGLHADAGRRPIRSPVRGEAHV